MEATTRDTNETGNEMEATTKNTTDAGVEMGKAKELTERTRGTIKKGSKDAFEEQPSIEELIADEKLEICVMQLPKYQEAKKVAKGLRKLGIEFGKIKKLSGKTFARLSFKDKESKEKAVTILRTIGFRGEPLPVFIARDMLSFAEKRSLVDDGDHASSSSNGDEPEAKRHRSDSADPRDQRDTSSSSSSSSSSPSSSSETNQVPELPNVDVRDIVSPLWRFATLIKLFFSPLFLMPVDSRFLCRGP